jgi:hypothetical protein
MKSDDDDDADGVITTRSTQNVCNVSHLKRRHLIMAILLLHNQQIIVQQLKISGLGSVVLPKKKKRYIRNKSVTTTEIINLLLSLFTHGMIPCSNGSLGYQEMTFMQYTKQLLIIKLIIMDMMRKSTSSLLHSAVDHW